MAVKLQATGNRLLSTLPKRECARLLTHLEPVSLKSETVLYDSGQRIRDVYFPIDAVVSLITSAQQGEGAVEVAMAGNEGIVGLPLFLGADSTPGRAVVQVSGDALRMRAGVFKEEIHAAGPLHDLLMRYTHALMSMISQTAACNGLHPVDGRLCRWLLMVHDRVGKDEFKIYQHFISDMLGVKRQTVSVTANMLQKAGLISYSRGSMKILDRRGLEDGVCKCYFVIKEQFGRLIVH